MLRVKSIEFEMNGEIKMTKTSHNTVLYKTQEVNDTTIFYREAGMENERVLVLLHGFPTSSHMFRNLIPILAENFHVIAPDLPGFGQTKAPKRGDFTYSFDNLTSVMEDFLKLLSFKEFALYVFDYGAPIGYRIAMNNPESITAIISQNGNAYLEGFGDSWVDWENYWHSPTAENREICRHFLSEEIIKNVQYLEGTNHDLVSPDGYTLDLVYLADPERQEIQLDLIEDYKSNLAVYPEFQAYFRTFQPPLLAAWGQNDIFFVPAGAKAYKTDLSNTEIQLFDTGHFALETHVDEIADLIIKFLDENL